MAMRRLWGGHVSVAGGVARAPQRGAACGLAAIQIFTRNQNRWENPPVDVAEAAGFRAERARWRIACVASHGSYLPNLASPDRALWRRSVAAVAQELARCRALGVDQLIFHPGAHMGAGEAAGIARVARALEMLLEQDGAPGGTRLLLESTAGQGTQLGWRFAHLRDILGAIRRPERVGVCLDTAHAFAAGHDLRTRAGYQAMFQALDAAVGWARLWALHVNDSKVGLGARVDRHEALGRGQIGAAAFRRLAVDPRLRELPFYLETPGGELRYSENLSVLRGSRRASSVAAGRSGASATGSSGASSASSRSSSAARRRRRT
jgi:deoxyribonuclease-4